MEYWVGFPLCFLVILHSAVHNLRSAIETGGDLMVWIMVGPERGTIKSSKFKVQS